MHVALIYAGTVPASLYGGIQRVIWCLGRELVRLGHRVTYIAGRGSQCDFADVVERNPEVPLAQQVPAGVDVVHFHGNPDVSVAQPYVVTFHGNMRYAADLDRNTIFVSADHAARFGSTQFVYNGLDWADYGEPDLEKPRSYFHFLGKAAWRVKNVQGAIKVVHGIPGARLHVLGGHRLNLRMGFRFTASPRVRFHGMVGGTKKHALLRGSRGLIFPVRWAEPFGLAIIESLYFGCPVFGTPYGSLPELVGPEYGFLSTQLSALSEAAQDAERFSPLACHTYARDRFSARAMTLAYVERYEKVLAGEPLNRTPPRLQEVPTSRFLPVG